MTVFQTSMLTLHWVCGWVYGIGSKEKSALRELPAKKKSGTRVSGLNPLEEAFLKAIDSIPHDWLPRLIFADWLEEQSDLRAELILLSHELMWLECADRERKGSRDQDLIQACGLSYACVESSVRNEVCTASIVAEIIVAGVILV